MDNVQKHNYCINNIKQVVSEVLLTLNYEAHIHFPMRLHGVVLN
jgi:hypothetical protein